MSTDPLLPVGRAEVSEKGANWLRRGPLWIYKSDVSVLPQRPGIVEVWAGARHLGWALCSPRSQISLRMLAWGAVAPPDAASLKQRLVESIARRERMMPGRNAFRAVHGEADGLPGLFVDRYDDAWVVQSTCAGADVLLEEVIGWLGELRQPRLVVVRNDVLAREREGLPQEKRVAVGSGSTRVRYREGDLEVEIDLLDDQKTGGFLDQVDNHVRAGVLGSGEALDCFTYHGGFALQLSQRCASVLACDISPQALERAKQNAERLGRTNVTFQEADVMELLPVLQKEGRLFDTIVLDPPAFASRKETVDKALHAYHRINTRALRLLRPGGLLVSCSCSGRITAEMFDEMLSNAARDAERRVQVLERRGAGLDHPVMLGVPETEYLKCRILVAL